MKVLTVFIDGLKPESIEYMPFLSTFSTIKRVKTELGYSNTCHASMYTGVYPNKHLVWFLWKHSPDTSPFKWIKNFRINCLPDNVYTKYIYYRITNLFYGHRYNSAFKLPFLWYIPTKFWPYFDVVEKKSWVDPNFLENYPTIFEILRDNNVDYEIVGFSGKMRALNKSFELVKSHQFKRLATWTYLFIGDIDPLSHEYGQNSFEVKTKLKEIDDILSKIFNIYEKQFGDFCFMLFSDHGHIMIKDKVNLYSFFRDQGSSLNDYIHFIDSNYARFWFRNEKERREVSRILSNMDDKGFILTEDDLKRYNVDMPDNRYGDLIFYLDVPYVFDRGNIFVMGKERSDTGKYISFHGYLPDYPDSDGVFISNKQVVIDSHIKLEDIMPSILYLLDLKIPDHVDGKVIWK